MTISWYPGHMHKAKKEIIKVLAKTHLLIEVLDARTPMASCNPLLAEITADLPKIKILNKADLADPILNKAWQSYFSAASDSACLVSGRDSTLSADQLVNTAAKLLSAKGHAGQTSAAQTQLMIAGIPNVGKSTLLNLFAERKLAKTGNEPAVTKGQQRIKLREGWYLLDTPGLLWPKLEDQDAAYRLACTGSIRNTAVDAEDIAWFLADLLLRDHYGALVKRYVFTQVPADAEAVLRHIATGRGSIGRGGHIDWHKSAETLLNDFRSGKLGRISLEMPP